MADRYSKEHCDDVHSALNENLLQLTKDVGYIKGQVDTLVDSQKELRQNNSDWWSRFVAFLACAIAYFKGA